MKALGFLDFDTRIYPIDKAADLHWLNWRILWIGRYYASILEEVRPPP